jgi:hypothetical protein
METTLFVATIIGFALMSQNIPSNDPSYSIHNYKHPNKAIAIVKRDTNKGIKVSFDETSRDYKKPAVKNKENVLQIFKQIDTKDYLKVKNYKMPNG